MSVNAMSFILPFESTQMSRSNGSNEDITLGQLWTEKYQPERAVDLCLPPKKIKDVRELIESSSIYGGKVKLIILTGQTGTGKSTMVRILAKENNLQVLEWEAEQRIVNDPDYMSTMERFENFLHDTTLRPSLNDGRRKLILLDDLPDLTTEDIKMKFQSIMSRYIQSPVPFLMVIIISDATSESVSSQYKSYDTRMTRAYDLLPEMLTVSPRVKTITVNPVTTLKMKKCLGEIVRKERSSALESDINDIIEMADGDLRFAINNLQFYFPRGTKGTFSSLSHDAKGSSRPLTIFHALGKVLHAKYEETGELESNPSDIIDGLPATADHFLSHIHTNLAGFRSLEDLEKGLEYMADADTMRTKDYSDNHCLSEIRSYVTVAGAMLSRTDPVPNPGRQIQKITKTNTHRNLNSQELVTLAVTLPNQATAKENDVWEEITGFSSDEDDNYDDIFGDGMDLAEMDY